MLWSTPEDCSLELNPRPEEPMAPGPYPLRSPKGCAWGSFKEL